MVGGLPPVPPELPALPGQVLGAAVPELLALVALFVELPLLPGLPLAPY